MTGEHPWGCLAEPSTGGRKNETRPLHCIKRLSGQLERKQRGEETRRRRRTLTGKGRRHWTSKPDTRTPQTFGYEADVGRGDRDGAHPKRGSSPGARAQGLYWRMRDVADEKVGCTRSSSRHHPLGLSPPRRGGPDNFSHHTGEQAQGSNGQRRFGGAATDSPSEQHPEVAIRAHAVRTDRVIGQDEKRRRQRVNGERGASIREAKASASRRTCEDEAADGEGNTSKGRACRRVGRTSRGGGPAARHEPQGRRG